MYSIPPCFTKIHFVSIKNTMRNRTKRAIKAPFRPRANKAAATAPETAIPASKTSIEPGLGGLTDPVNGTPLVEDQSRYASITRDL